MVRILLFRHAEAADAEPGVADLARPLTGQGLRDALAAGDALAMAGYFPDLILCSPARRTRQTLAAALPRLIEGMPDSGAIRFLPPLYGGGDYSALAREDAGDAEAVMLIGHNPTIHQTARALAGQGDAQLLAELAGKFPTSAVAVIDFDGGWRGVKAGGGRLVDFIVSR